jgi:UDP-N-acetyl-2-amino-2-deoxyglucuronate dehydrogenase
LQLKADIDAAAGAMHEVTLTYVTARGPWYDVSWKGSEERSGGLVTNIGIHLFDLLVWIFGRVGRSSVHLRGTRRASGSLELQRAHVRWFLSTEPDDLPFAAAPGARTSFRSMNVDGREIEFTDGMGRLHTEAYEEILAGRGFGTADARSAIELVHQIRTAPVRSDAPAPHPMLFRGA